ncbi:hypothetical protein BAUCODRAFT_63908 [Baudoinia panamericana UAMH 10762]|uniref:GS catalytic domain-containing protein n=1 Tax=Baudoinia panamericana (strain UAMH 10762) TaxID=717646 RepID=M2LZR5_BAUPA|nr:uncharacterized protein BAUCODRAFT_63908 [Baudoinia panamericana UAMH 10762]EMD00203.1 hypothetical protein BAUCODRAFT_63908 [Baudoinia panamericana UAMH 10762]
MAKIASASLAELKRVIRTQSVVDNHGHNILRPEKLKSANFLTITTEAEGDALEDARRSLPHLRAARQLRKLYGLPSTADWATILGKRVELLERDAHGLMEKCFGGTHTILVDDGLDSGANVESYEWHSQYTLSPCKRIVRIESIAATILSSMDQQGNLPVGVATADDEACSLAWVTFITQFEQAIVACIGDSEVVGFKSVVCYRTGLDVQVGDAVEVLEAGLRSFTRHYLPDCAARSFRVEAKGMNDALVVSVCRLLEADCQQLGATKPLQFHTGLGDNDIDLLGSNPAFLQPLIKHFSTVPMVLLHSSYPYTREAGYLATVYKNVYVDIGEVFPMVSRDGQEQIVRQALEITPASKILWSTDGHYFPETYWLANVQGREVIEKVLCQYVEQDDLTAEQAIHAARNILFENSNALYRLGLSIDASDSAPSTRTASTMPAPPDRVSNELPRAESTGLQVSIAPSSLATSAMSNNPEKTLLSNVIQSTVLLADDSDVQFIVVQWLDLLNQLRARWLPVGAFKSLIASDGSIGISTGNLGTLQNDHMTPVCDPVGQILVAPVLASMRLMYASAADQVPKQGRIASVMACFLDEDRQPHSLCPRSLLLNMTNKLRVNHQVDLLVGFEIEVTFCHRRVSSENNVETFEPFDTNHAWGTVSDEQITKSFPVLLKMVTALQQVGIEVQQLHSESGVGQYEFVLNPMPPVQAVDVLIQARQLIQHAAASQGLRATFHPMPFPGVGSASHANISLNSSVLSPADLEQLQMSFMASVLAHLPALCAFSMPQAESYDRVVDDSWTGGTWIAWGTQNREVPLRRVGADKAGKGSRWELRCVDGVANMYLALGCILGAGLAGIENQTRMNLQDCRRNPTKLSDDEKRALGITQRIPNTLTQALQALEDDEALAAKLSSSLVQHYLAVKRTEQDTLKQMSDAERRVWLMNRY